MTGGPTAAGRPAVSALHQASRTLLIRCTVVTLAAVTGIVIARSLGPEGRGAYAIVVTLAATALALGHLSVDQAHATLWPGTRVDANPVATRRDTIAANSTLLGPALGTATALVTFGVVRTGVTGLGAVTHSGLLVVALFSVPISMTVLYLSNVLVLDGRVGMVDWSTLVGNIAQCGALLTAAALGWLTVALVVWIWTITTAVPLMLMLVMARPRWRHRNLGLAGRSIWLGVRYHGGSAALYLTYRVDVLILGAMAGTAEVGLYTLAVTLAELIRMPTDAFARACLARQMTGDLEQAATVTARATRMSVVLAGTCVVALCVAAPVLIPVTYGPVFAQSVPALFALAPGLFALGAGRQVSAYLVRLNRPLTMSALSVGALAINVAVNLWAIPRWGIVGCALASSISYALVAAVQVIRFARATRIPIRRLLPGPAEVTALGRRLSQLVDRVRFRPRLDRVWRLRPRPGSVPDPMEQVLVAAQAAPRVEADEEEPTHPA